MPEYPPPPRNVPYNRAPNADVPTKIVEPAFVTWATQKGYVVNPYASAGWYQAWGPFVFLFEIEGVGMEVAADFGDADLWLVEAYEDSDIEYKQGKAQHDLKDRRVIAFITSPHLKYRAALRWRLSAGVKEEFGRSLGALFKSTASRPTLGDNALESLYEVAVPSREEGNAALTPTLRQMFLQHKFEGILELRAGGMVCSMHHRHVFDPSTIDGTIAMLGDIYRAAITYA